MQPRAARGATRSPSQHQRRLVLGSRTAAHQPPRPVCRAAGTDAEQRLAWYEKQEELWVELADDADYATATGQLASGQLLVVDYYAPWCSVCKSAYPAMCRIAGNADMADSFVFAKASIDASEVKARIKAEGVLGIPYVSVYRADGTKATGFPASFKKISTVRSNLETLAKHSKELPGSWGVDPNGHLLPVDVAHGVTHGSS